MLSNNFKNKFFFNNGVLCVCVCGTPIFDKNITFYTCK